MVDKQIDSNQINEENYTSKEFTKIDQKETCKEYGGWLSNLGIFSRAQNQ